MKLTLDKEALEALFPEGSEARVELKRAIVADLVKRLVPADVKHLSADLQAAVRKVAQDELRQHGVTEGRFSREVLISEHTRDAIRAQTRNELEAIISEARRQIVTGSEHEIAGKVRTAVGALIDYTTRTGIKAVVKECLAEMMGR